MIAILAILFAFILGIVLGVLAYRLAFYFGKARFAEDEAFMADVLAKLRYADLIRFKRQVEIELSKRVSE